MVAIRGVQPAHPKLGVPGRQQVRYLDVLFADLPLLLHRHACRVRNGRARALCGMDAPPIRRTAPEAHAARPARDARRRPGYGRALDDSTGALLPVSVGLGLLSGGTDQRMARSPLACEVPGARGLAARGGASCRRAGVRLLMGDVELLVLSEVDLPYSRRRVPAHLRDAALGLHRLSALRAGALRAGTAHRAAPAEPAPVGLGDGYWMPHPGMLTVVPYPTLPSPPHGPCCSRTAIRPHRVILVPTRASLRPPLKTRPPTCGSREGRGFEPRRSPHDLQDKRLRQC